MWCEAVGDQRSARCGKRSVPSDPHRLRPGSSWEDPFRKGRPSTVGRHPASGWASCSHGRSLSWPARMSARTSSAGQRRIRAASPTQIGSPRTANCWTSDSFNLRALLRGPYTGRSPRPIRFQTRCRVILRMTPACAVVIRGSPTMRGSPNSVSPADKSATSFDATHQSLTPPLARCPAMRRLALRPTYRAANAEEGPRGRRRRPPLYSWSFPDEEDWQNQSPEMDDGHESE
jgi:hypothetical protein